MAGEDVKAQTAFEMLMSYGWAILVITIVVGILYAMGVFNPSNVAPSSCKLPAGLSCKTFKIDKSARLTLEIGQSTGKTLRVTGVGCSKAANPAPTAITSVDIASGESKYVTNVTTVTCKESNDATAATSSSYYKGKLVINYSEVESGLPHQVEGEIAARLE